MQIEIYSDVVCPWCWIGEQRLYRALADSPDVSVRWRAFQLDPSAQSTGTPLVEWLGRRYGGEANARRMFAQVSSVAAEEGLAMDFDRAIGANTFDAHRLIWWAGEQGRDQRPMVEALHRAHFTDGLDLGDRDDLVRTAVSLKHDERAVREFLDSTEGADEVLDELAMGRELGVTGVPMFVFAGKYAISGAQDPSTLREVLDEVRRREGAAPLLTDLAPRGEACDDDSCAV
ncbi:DsbA family oxidoreductase [Catellatospora sp. KI3]|uniref:DsbA family oxidoreductase n=1 Tax=Catellatospora sp. KI3 TaxID=3041620 RepID=UPI00248308DC|nr:DsbA family oxidoreductase [Catellatospora sp. KI3]MDI1464165.1 DsbA family oxidoreductase [Catellatospora sp. KI3]